MKKMLALFLLIVVGLLASACEFGSGAGRGPDAVSDVQAQGEINKTTREPAQMEGMTAAHNEYRLEKHDVSLVWDDEVAAYAQEWAEYLRDNHDCQLQHRSWLGMDKVSYGENLYGASAWGMVLQTTPQQVVDAWWSEVEFYDYDTDGCTDVCGHYTQVMWESSTRLGCGVAFCNDGQTDVWVCNYDPPGNWIGMKPW